MVRVRHSWREACALALRESDPAKLFSRIEYALTTLERRYAECEFDPLKPNERRAIQKTIAMLERAMREKLSENRKVDPRAKKISHMMEDSILRELGHAKHLFLIPPP